MSNSSLVDYTKISPNSNNPRNNTIQKITIHHMAGNLSVETCGNIFASSSRQASSNYGIGSDGRVGMYVEEANRSWASASPSNDNQAVSIEVANDGGADTNWHVSDVALKKLIELCVDICKRNNFRLNWTGDVNGTLTVHRMFINTTCPGEYLMSKMQYIADEVNRRLDEELNPEPEKPLELGDKVLILNGYATADSYGNGAKTAERNGDINDEKNIKYITKIVDLDRVRPYHLSTGNSFGNGDFGWVSSDQIKRI